MYTSFKSNSQNPKHHHDHHETTPNKKFSEISHFGHKQHKLTFDYSESPFQCDGCKELGIGSRYSCSLCDFDLHTHCSIPSPSLFHPFYPKCSFHFLSHPPGNTPRYCNACQKPVKGFLFHCFSCGFDLHPCCAKLPTVIGSDDNKDDSDKNEVRLLLYRTVRSACHRCGQKGRGWSYRSSCKRYNLHVACVRELVVESWHEGGGLKTLVESGCHKGRGGKGGRVRRCCEVAGVAVQVAVSAVLGDPTALIAGIVGSLVSRA
ncbi:uncharacterized protein LOC114173007 [Vigna unguiculata]|uniref:C1-like n=1 Tax=Vigna unguiculata TaxID=3917 RepID=A0A4D6LLA9_VIGUN|nr:uncharacterized protein LOC114173007 [Vigna unguiculata]QCD89371.1 C1-like [Vigna unguiculata]QCE00929.1 C1-like [Vigna unguiculata]